jgi:hypothetical protein
LTAGGLAVPLRLLITLDDALVLLPAPARVSSPAEISARLACARRRFDTSDLARLVADLPDLLAVVHEVAKQDGDPAAHVRLAACYDLATEALSKIGRYSSSRITADRATTCAAMSGSPIAMAASARALGIVLRHEGRQRIADQITLKAAGRLEVTGLVTPAQSAAYTQMLYTCAYNAAQAGDRDRALELITEAERAAARLPDHPVGGQPFTVTQPRSLSTVSVSTGPSATLVRPCTLGDSSIPVSSPHLSGADGCTLTWLARGGSGANLSRPPARCWPRTTRPQPRSATALPSARSSQT